MDALLLALVVGLAVTLLCHRLLLEAAKGSSAAVAQYRRRARLTAVGVGLVGWTAAMAATRLAALPAW